MSVELPKLPNKAKLYTAMPDDYRYGHVYGYTADHMREYGRAVERAAYERAAQECEAQISGSDYAYLATHGHWDHMAQSATNCADAIRALKSKPEGA